MISQRGAGSIALVALGIMVLVVLDLAHVRVRRRYRRRGSGCHWRRQGTGSSGATATCVVVVVAVRDAIAVLRRRPHRQWGVVRQDGLRCREARTLRNPVWGIGDWVLPHGVRNDLMKRGAAIHV